MLAAREEAAGGSTLQEALGEVEERAVPSALEMVEEIWERMGVGLRAYLLMGHR